jgi:DNA-binding CsgD family transcriptional regulator
MLDFTTYPSDYAPVNELGNRLFPRRLEAIGEGWRHAIRNGLVYAPAIDTRDRAIAADVERLMLAPAGLKGLLGGFFVDGNDLLGAVSVGGTREHRTLLRSVDEPLAAACRAASHSIAGALRMAAAAGWAPPRRRTIAARLSLREQEVARLAAHGYSNLNIARRLGLAEPTVSAHLQHVYRKLGIHSRVALARLFG